MVGRTVALTATRVNWSHIKKPTRPLIAFIGLGPFVRGRPQDEALNFEISHTNRNMASAIYQSANLCNCLKVQE